MKPPRVSSEADRWQVFLNTYDEAGMLAHAGLPLVTHRGFKVGRIGPFGGLRLDCSECGDMVLELETGTSMDEAISATTAHEVACTPLGGVIYDGDRKIAYPCGTSRLRALNDSHRRLGRPTRFAYASPTEGLVFEVKELRGTA